MNKSISNEVRNLPLFSRPPFLLLLLAGLFIAGCECHPDCNRSVIDITPVDGGIVGDALVFPAEGGDKDATIKTTLCWEVIDQPDWIESIVPNSGCGTVTVTVTAKPNSGDIRTGTITVRANNGDRAEIKVIQKNFPQPFWSSIATGPSQIATYAIKSDGSLWEWGYDNYGLCGPQLTPMCVIDGGITAVSTNRNHTFAIKSDGSLWVWGDDEGNLGLGAWIGANPPACVIDGGVKAVAAGEYANYAVKTDGSFWAWGAYDNSSSYGPLSPVCVLTSGVTEVTAGACNYALFIKTDGSLWALGDNMFGQLGDGTTTNSFITPVCIMAGGVTMVKAGAANSFAIKSDGSLWAWGRNNFGQLGDGTTTDSSIPVCIMEGGVKAVAAAGWHSLAIKTDGSLWAWGRNDFGQLGDGTTTNSLIPVRIPE